MNLQEFKNEMQSVYKTGRDFTEEVISLRTSLRFKISDSELAQVIVDFLNEIKEDKYDYQKSVGTILFKLPSANIIQSGLIRKDVMPLLTTQRFKITRYADFVAIINSIEDDVQKKHYLNLNAIDSLFALRMYKEGVIDKHVFVQSKQCENLISGFFRSYKSNITKKQIQNLKDVYDVVLNLKTSEEYNEEQNFKILQKSILSNSGIVEVLSDKNRYEFMCDLLNAQAIDEDRKYVLQLIEKTHLEKFEKLLEMISNTKSIMIYRSLLETLTTHATPDNFDVLKYKDKIKEIVEYGEINNFINKKFDKYFYHDISVFIKEKPGTKNPKMTSDSVLREVKRQAHNPVLLKLKKVENTEIELDMSNPKNIKYKAEWLAYYVYCLKKVKLVNLDYQSPIVSYLIKYGLTNKIKNKNENIISSLSEKMLKNGEITKGKYQNAILSENISRQKMKLI